MMCNVWISRQFVGACCYVKGYQCVGGLCEVNATLLIGQMFFVPVKSEDGLMAGQVL